MHCFTEYLPRFRNEAKVVDAARSGYEDGVKTGTIMLISRSTSMLLSGFLEDGNGDCFSWRGELIFVRDERIVSNKVESALLGFIGINLAACAVYVQSVFKSHLANIRAVCELCVGDDVGKFRTKSRALARTQFGYFIEQLESGTSHIGQSDFDISELFVNSVVRVHGCECWGITDWVDGLRLNDVCLAASKQVKNVIKCGA